MADLDCGSCDCDCGSCDCDCDCGDGNCCDDDCCKDCGECCKGCCNILTCFLCTSIVDDCLDSTCDRCCESCCMAMANPEPSRNNYVGRSAEPRGQRMYRNEGDWEVQLVEQYQKEHGQNGVVISSDVQPNGQAVAPPTAPPPSYDSVIAAHPVSPAQPGVGTITSQPGDISQLSKTPV